MNISLTRELESLVTRRVKSGRYGSASEVVREALRLLDERDRLRELRFLELKRDVLEGVSDLDAGDAAPLDLRRLKAEGRDRLRARSGKPRSAR